MNKYITNLWKEKGGGHYTHQDDMYIEYLYKLLPKFSRGKVLEIGPGTGRFALKLIDSFGIKDYNLLDLEKNIFDSIIFLKSRGFTEITYYFSQNYKDLFNEKYDLLVANVVIPETPKKYREDLLNNVIPNCKNAMIIGMFLDKEYEIWIKDLFNKNFDVVKCELTQYLNCYCLTGEKL